MSLIENVARMPDWPTDTFKTTLPLEFTTGPTSIWFDLNAEGDGGAKGYMLVQFADAVTYAAGQPVVFENQNLKIVTNDISAGFIASKAPFAGVCMGVSTENQYGWIQICGEFVNSVTHTDVIAGDWLVVNIADARFDNTTTSLALVDHDVCAYALEADDSGATDIMIIPSQLLRAYI